MRANEVQIPPESLLSRRAQSEKQRKGDVKLSPKIHVTAHKRELSATGGGQSDTHHITTLTHWPPEEPALRVTLLCRELLSTVALMPSQKNKHLNIYTESDIHANFLFVCQVGWKEPEKSQRVLEQLKQNQTDTTTVNNEIKDQLINI